jgi:tetratricopeptide (TPR) repeat protein
MYNSLGEEERELLHEAILDVLKEEWETAIEEGELIATLAARLARHAEVLKQYRFAAEVLLASARSSWREHAAEEVLRLTEEILVCLGNLKPKQIDSGVEKLRGEAQALRALVYRRFSRNEEATAAYHEALEAFERGGAKERAVDLLNGASRIPWREGRYEEAEVAMREALAKAESIDYAAGQALGHANLASLYYRLARYGEATEECMKSLELYRSVGNTEGESTVLTTLGNVYYKAGDFGRSLEYQKQSLALKEKDGDMLGQAASLGNLGLIYARQGDFESSLEFLMRGMEIFDRVGDRHELAVALGNIGSVYSNLDEKEKALEYFLRSLEIRQAIHDRYGEAFSLSDIGAEYHNLGDLEKALEYQLKAYEIRIAIHDRYGEAASLMLIGAIYKVMEAADQARETLEEGLKLATEIGSNLLLVQGYGTLGEVAMIESATLAGPERTARLQEAIENFRRAIALEPEVGSREVEQWKKHLAEAERIIDSG